MKTTLENYEYPDTEEQLTVLLEQTYQQLTGVSLSNREPVFVERYSHGGMSSGHISPQFWAEHAIPMLLERYRESKKALLGGTDPQHLHYYYFLSIISNSPTPSSETRRDSPTGNRE